MMIERLIDRFLEDYKAIADKAYKSANYKDVASTLVYCACMISLDVVFLFLFAVAWLVDIVRGVKKGGA